VFSLHKTYVLLRVLFRKYVIKVILVGWLNLIQSLRSSSSEYSSSSSFEVQIVFVWLGFCTRVSFLRWGFTGSLSIFDFFNRYHFFFHISFVPPSFEFWWRWFFLWCLQLFFALSPSTSISSLSVFSQSTVWCKISSFHGGTPLLDFNLHLFSSTLLFGLGQSICYSRQVFFGTLGWVMVVDLFF